MNFNILFPDEREAGETRLRQSQLVMLRLLKIFDYLCSKYSINYFLTGGSLLGAVRHRGFIPWDDDLDIAITRENYEKFVQFAVPELPADIFFQNSETDKHYPACDYVEAKLRDKYSSYNVNKYKYHDGIQLDIFVYDKAFLPHNLFVIIQNSVLKPLGSNKKRAKILKWISIHVPLPFVYASSYMQKMGMIKIGTYLKEREISTLIRTKFEDIEVYIPVGYDSQLKRQYGDYMKLPTKEKQVTHHQNLPDPFTPCEHEQTLLWESKK